MVWVKKNTQRPSLSDNGLQLHLSKKKGSDSLFKWQHQFRKNPQISRWKLFIERFLPPTDRFNPSDDRRVNLTDKRQRKPSLSNNNAGPTWIRNKSEMWAIDSQVRLAPTVTHITMCKKYMFFFYVQNLEHTKELHRLHYVLGLRCCRECRLRPVCRRCCGTTKQFPSVQICAQNR